MVLSGDLLSWDVPGDAHDSFARVSVEVSDEDGKTLTHGFVLKIVVPGEPVR